MSAVSIEKDKSRNETLCLFSIDVNLLKNGMLGVGVTQQGMNVIEYAVESQKVEQLIKELNNMLSDSVNRIAKAIEHKTEIQLDN